MLGCFHSLQRVLTMSVDSCTETECPFSGITKSGRVWRKVPESDALSMTGTMYYWRRAFSILLCAHLANGYPLNMMISGWTAEHAVTRTQFGRHLSEFGLIKVRWALWFPFKKIKEWNRFYDWKICFCSMYQTRKKKRKKTVLIAFRGDKLCVLCGHVYPVHGIHTLVKISHDDWHQPNLVDYAHYPWQSKYCKEISVVKVLHSFWFGIVQHIEQCITSQTKEKTPMQKYPGH